MIDWRWLAISEMNGAVLAWRNSQLGWVILLIAGLAEFSVVVRGV